MTSSNPTSTALAPPCPPWCALLGDHELDDIAIDGTEFCWDHEHQVGRVCSAESPAHNELLVDVIAQDGVVDGQARRTVEPRVWVGSCSLNPAEARGLAQMIMQAANLAEQWTAASAGEVKRLAALEVWAAAAAV